jgi:hypothetical protein
MTTYNIFFKLSSFDENGCCVPVDVLDDYYPEFIDELEKAFQNRGIFTFQTCGINFANAIYYYVELEKSYE